jgi:hypothetical protein
LLAKNPEDRLADATVAAELLNTLVAELAR